MCSGRQSRPHLFHVVRKVCTKSGHVSTIPPVVKNNSHHGISTIKSDYPFSKNATEAGNGLSGYWGISFDASRVTSAYGRSSTVQPASTRLLYCIKS